MTRLREPGNREAYHDDLSLVLFSFDLDIIEAYRQRHRGVHIVIVHRYAQTVLCAPGEEIARAYIVHKGKQYPIPLSTVHLILLDYLCRHRGIAQTATQIARGLSSEAFYVQHGMNREGSAPLRTRTSRTAVKEQMMRLRLGIARCLTRANIAIAPRSILCAQNSTSNEVAYQIGAEVIWEHTC